MGDRAVLIVAMIGLGFLLGLSVGEASAKRETDAQKWDRIEANRMLRRATEAKFNACYKECLK